VVLDALMRGVGVVADRRADPGQLAGGDRGADAGAADEDAAVRVTGEDRLADLASLVRVVHPDRVGLHAAIQHLVTQASKRLEHRLPQVDAAMVEGDDDPHVTRSSSAVAFATTLSTL